MCKSIAKANKLAHVCCTLCTAITASCRSSRPYGYYRLRIRAGKHRKKRSQLSGTIGTRSSNSSTTAITTSGIMLVACSVHGTPDVAVRSSMACHWSWELRSCSPQREKHCDYTQDRHDKSCKGDGWLWRGRGRAYWTAGSEVAAGMNVGCWKWKWSKRVPTC